MEDNKSGRSVFFHFPFPFLPLFANINNDNIKKVGNKGIEKNDEEK